MGGFCNIFVLFCKHLCYVRCLTNESIDSLIQNSLRLEGLKRIA